MAQHIPIENFKQKRFGDIHQSILKEFNGKRSNRGSLKYIYRYDKWGAIDENDEVYDVTRHIGKGFVWGSSKGDFEIHFDTKSKKVTNIYLVA